MKITRDDAKSYEKMAESHDRTGIVELLRERGEYVKRGGKLIASDDAFAAIAKKYGISFDSPPPNTKFTRCTPEYHTRRLF